MDHGGLQLQTEELRRQLEKMRKQRDFYKRKVDFHGGLEYQANFNLPENAEGSRGGGQNVHYNASNTKMEVAAGSGLDGGTVNQVDHQHSIQDYGFYWVKTTILLEQPDVYPLDFCTVIWWWWRTLVALLKVLI
jgi:hypothetical protein